jgi:filamentous hemagglutinin family protein
MRPAPACSLVALAFAGVIAAAPCALLAAPPGTVLPPGTLPQLRIGGVVSGAVVGAPTPTATGSLLTINQSAPRAIIDWGSFNIGSGSEVRFVQPSTSAAVLNRIFDADPSIIQGRLTANGQVFLLNRNGILFDRGAQVNVNTLVATTVTLTQQQFLDGIVAGLDRPAFDGADAGSAIRIGAFGPAGAGAPVLRTEAGGSILLVAPRIENEGILEAPGGQVILAAGHKVYLAANDPRDFAMRGLLVEVEAAQGDVNLSSLIRNAGSISSARGNVTLAGLAINQSGRVTADSAILLNGSVWLQARERPRTAFDQPTYNPRSGRIETGPGSLTATPLDATDRTTFTADQAYDPYRAVVKLEAGTIVHRGAIDAPAGRVWLRAFDPAQPALTNASRIYLEAGSRISVAGATAALPAEASLVEVPRLTSNDLKDAPAQKGGILQGAAVTVDARRPVRFFDVTPYANNRTRTLAEAASGGGSITLASEGDFILRAGATLDVSGGAVAYGAGRLYTSKLIAEDRRIYDIHDAPKELRYIGILDRQTRDYERWGITETFLLSIGGLGTPAAASLEGRPGGSLAIVAPGGVILDGRIVAGAAASPGQIARNAIPSSGELVLGGARAPGPVPDYQNGSIVFARAAPLPEHFEPASPLGGRGETVYVDPGLFRAAAVGTTGERVQPGFSALTAFANEEILVPAGVTLAAPPFARVSLTANRTHVGGAISAPGGAISLVGTPTVGGGAGTVTLAPFARVSAAGLWVNDAPTNGGAAPLPMPLAIGGGTVTASAAGAVTIGAGAIVDVSGGARLDPRARLQRGNGGAIVIETGRGAADDRDFGAVVLDGELRGHAPGRGGSLTVRAARALVSPGGGAAGADPLTLALDPGFFARGGFTQYSIAGRRGVTLAPGVALAPVADRLAIDLTLAGTAPSGASLEGLAQVERLPVGLRDPVGLAFSAGSPTDGDIVLAAGSSIVLDPRATFSASGTTGVDVGGKVAVPGGTVNLAAAISGVGVIGTGAVRLRSGSVIDASGTTVLTPNDRGLSIGEVIAGGTVSLSAVKQSIVVEPGAAIDVSGAAALLDRPVSAGLDPGVRPTWVYSDAGALRIAATEAVDLRGELRARAAPGGAGGTFSLELRRSGDLAFNAPRVVVIAQEPVAPAPAPGLLIASFAVGPLARGGIDRLRVVAEDGIEFAGAVDAAFARGIQLDSPLLAADGARPVRLGATHVTLANTFTDPQRPPAPAGGAASFVVDAQTIDLVGAVRVARVGQVTLAATGDLRGSGRPTRVGAGASLEPDTLLGSLTVPANLDMRAAQIYPTTLSDFTFTATGARRIAIAPSGSVPGEALSAGGRIAIQADMVRLGGQVVAPLGEIAIAAREIALLDGSVTSVAGANRPVPFGGTVGGRTWRFAGLAPLTGLREKRIALEGADVQVLPGARIDLSGGGEVLGIEFVSGPGGSVDRLLADGTFAILPDAVLGATPFDADLALRRDLGFGPLTLADRPHFDTITLAGGGVPAGTYRLLPGYYANLPGAYVVRPQTGSVFRGLQPGEVRALADGTPVVGGYRSVAGTGVREAETIGVAVLSGALLGREAEYRLTRAGFFAEQAALAGRAAPPSPADAGALSLAATASLRLGGTIVAAPAADGRRARVDIDSQFLAVVDRIDQPLDPRYLKLESGALSALDGSVLIGGSRRTAPDGSVTLTARAREVLVANSGASPLVGPDLLLAAIGEVRLAPGAVVRAEGALAGDPAALAVTGDGALVRAAGGATASIARSGVSVGGGSGTVTVEAGALLYAGGSLYLDGTRSARVDGQVAVADGAAATLGARRIALGSGAIGDGLALTTAQLAGLGNADTLRLTGYQSIDFAQPLVLAGRPQAEVVLDTPRLRASGLGLGEQVHLAAGRITLVAPANATLPATSATGNAALVLAARELVVGGGAKAIEGFGRVTLGGAEAIVADGTGELRVAGELTLATARVQGSLAADQRWTAATGAGGVFPIALSRPVGAAPGAAPGGVGASLTLAGSSITQGTSIELPAGRLSLLATGPAATGGVAFAPGSTTVLDGAARDFSRARSLLDGGTIDIAAADGLVRVAPGARLSVAGAAAGGNAGEIRIRAAGAAIDGELAGGAAAGFRSGSISIDVASAASFATLNSAAEVGGFGGARFVRLRGGPLEVGAGDSITAERVRLVADAGAIVVRGRIDASGLLGGGTVALEAGTDLTLAAGSVVRAAGLASGAGAADPYAHGGMVTASARDGAIEFAAGATIDVSAGAKGNAGTIVFRAPRTATNDAVRASLAGTVSGRAGGGPNGGRSARVIVEGVRAANVTAIDTSTGSTYYADYAAFMSAADPSGYRASLALDGVLPGDVRVRAGIELRGSGNLALADAWDLTDPAWLIGGEPGTLTIRTTGTLTVAEAIGFQFDDFLPLGETWTLRLGAGVEAGAASLASLRPLEALVAANSGDLVLQGPAAKLRTGTGDIELYAGRDFRITNPAAVVYTAGEPGPSGDPFTLYPSGGGSIAVVAQRDAIGTDLRTEWLNGWLRRSSYSIQADADLARGAGWWVHRPNFRHHLGALAGGDVRISAGRDVSQLSAFLPTTGEVVDPRASPVLTVRGGGDLEVRAGGDVIGGEYLVGRGRGAIVAGRAAGAQVPVTLFVMGESDDPGARGADLAVAAKRGAAIQNVGNPTALALTAETSGDPGFENVRQFLFTYAPASAVRVVTATGDVVLSGEYRNSGYAIAGPRVFPPAVALEAPYGSIRSTAPTQQLNETFALFPSETGLLRVLAAGEVARLRILASDLDTAYLPAWNNLTTPDFPTLNNFTTRGRGIPQLVRPLAFGGIARSGAANTRDGAPYVVEALAGDIFESYFYFPQRAFIGAGGDLESVRLELQHTAPGDLTVVRAGRDLRYPDQLRSGQQQGDTQIGINIGGPGELLLQAGRTVDMGGRTRGITATARQDNPNLASGASARLIVAAGLVGELPVAELDAFFAALKAAGLDNDPAAAQAALAKLLPAGTIRGGNIDTFFSPIQTVGGSGIDLLAPAGDINAGLTSATTRPLGIQTIRGGAIRAYLSGDFNVNQAKVLTAQGGDILIYTSQGSIDAGRGALTSRTTEPPRVTRDAQGNLVFEFSVDVAGSGIRSATSDPDGPGPLAPPPAGDVFLFAPRGTIDAGEAGIAAGGSLVVAALQVLNAANISVGGTSVGVPTAAVSIAAGLTGASNVAAGATRAAEEAARAVADKPQAAVGQEALRPSFLTIEVLGFGDERRGQ